MVGDSSQIRTANSIFDEQVESKGNLNKSFSKEIIGFAKS
jgi:hypothetical protein